MTGTRQIPVPAQVESHHHEGPKLMTTTATTTIDRDHTAGFSAGAASPRDGLKINTGAPLHKKVDHAIEAVAAGNDLKGPRVMVRGKELVRMTERGELEPYNVDSMCDH